jgi:pectinesterase
LYVRNGNGRSYFGNCYIEGNTDFIFGAGTAAFEYCQIHSKADGYVTAASTPADHRFGLVFLDCRLTGVGKSYLGRPWRPDGAVAFVCCEMGEHIRPEGWHNWGKESNEKTARFAEYMCTGPGADRSKRVPWSKELSADQTTKLTRLGVVGGDDDWQANAAAPWPTGK